jgi:hypothetical protein
LNPEIVAGCVELVDVAEVVKAADMAQYRQQKQQAHAQLDQEAALPFSGLETSFTYGHAKLLQQLGRATPQTAVTPGGTCITILSKLLSPQKQALSIIRKSIAAKHFGKR